MLSSARPEREPGDSQGAWFDHDWRLRKRRTTLTAATLVPLFCGLATVVQGERTAQAIASRLLAPAGLGTTEQLSSEQWDRPNGWAPFHWLAVVGLCRYGHPGLARVIRSRWLATVTDLYLSEGKLVEKYALHRVDSEAVRGGDGSEYPLQDGFGWTNGVVGHWLARKTCC